MQVRYFKKIFDEIDSATESDAIINLYSDVLGIQVEGSFSALSLKVLGKATKESEAFVELSAINLTSFDLTDSITAAGIYEVGIEGICIIKLEIESISGGAATVNVRLVSTGN